VRTRGATSAMPATEPDRITPTTTAASSSDVS